jgi:hypothetical protein
MADFGNAFSMAMRAGSGLIDAQMKRDDAIDAEKRAADRQISVEGRLTAIREAANARAEERREQMRVSGRKTDFEFDTSPDNVKAKAAAQASELEATEPVKARLRREAALADASPEMLDAKRKTAQATHIESASSIAAANLSAYQLKKAQEFESLQNSYSDAVASGDTEKSKELASRIEAKNFTGKAKDVQAYIHAATQARKLASDAMDPAEKEELKNKAILYEKLAGVDTQKAAANRPPDAAIEYLKKNPQLADQFKKKYPGYDLSEAINPRSTPEDAPKRGLIDSVPPSAKEIEGVPSYNKWLSAKRKMDEVNETAKNMSPDRRQAYLDSRLPEIQAEVAFHSKYKTF